MRIAFVVALAVAFGVQPVSSQSASSVKAAPASKQAPTKQKTMSVSWEEHIPSVGCDGGTPVLNVELPDAGAPTAMCEGVQPPDVLQHEPLTTTSTAQDGAYDVGTVIVMGFSHDKIVVAADSRNVQLTTTPLADGTVKTKIKYDDCACKLTQLTPTILFAADGQVWAGKTMPATTLYDAHKLARLAAQNYHSSPSSQEEQLAGGMIAAIAIRWAWDVDFRMHHGFANGWTPMQTLEGIFAGLEPNGETAIAVAKLKYPKPRTGLRVPPVTFSVGTMNPPPTDFTWVEAFGMKDVAEQLKGKDKRIGGEILKDPKLFSPTVPERLVDLTIQHYTTAAGPKDPLFVHGPIDVAVLERNKEINWIHWKKCSGVKRAPSHKPALTTKK